MIYRDDLTKLAIIYKSDKWGWHSYTQHYAEHFRKFRNKKINLLEIGVGGYDDTSKGGESLRMWKRYFPYAKIYSIDIYDKSALQEHRIHIFKGHQIDKNFLEKVMERISTVDIIIDDGSHVNGDVIGTFTFLFPKLKNGGVYVVEDVQTSYWPSYGGDSDNLNNPSTIMSFFKSLTDGLNYREFLRQGYCPTYWDMNILSLHFYHNLIFIYKGENIEESNLVRHNEKIL